MVLAACQKDPAESPAPDAQPAAPQQQAVAPGGEAPPAAAEPAASAIPEDMSIADMLAAARQALTDENVVTPAGASAVDYYVAVLAKEPNNATAAQALVDVFPMAVSVAEREIAQRRLDEATRIVDLLDRASPNSFSVRSLRERVTAARDAEERALLAQEQALERQREAEAEARELAAQQAAQPAAEPVEEPAASDPAVAAPQEPEPQPESAPPPVPTPQPAVATPAPVPVGETRPARVLRQVQPTFPPEAARRRQQGWVELSFTIGVDGRVSNVTVVGAQPPRAFDRAAIAAMQQWTFEPALRDGQPIPSRGARRMEFRL
jgi:protein TonB